MRWTDEATELFADLIAFLPTSLRPIVEEDAETHAERMALDGRRDEITPELALYSLVECTPVHMRARLMEAVGCRNAWKEERRQTIDGRR